MRCLVKVKGKVQWTVTSDFKKATVLHLDVTEGDQKKKKKKKKKH